MKKKSALILVAILVLTLAFTAVACAQSPISIEYYNGDKLMRVEEFKKGEPLPTLSERGFVFEGWEFEDKTPFTSESDLKSGTYKVFAKWRVANEVEIAFKLADKTSKVKLFEGDTLEEVDLIKDMGLKANETFLGLFKDGKKVAEDYKFEKNETFVVNYMTNGLEIKNGVVSKLSSDIGVEQIVIPFEYNGFKVSKIGTYIDENNFIKGAFEDCRNVTSVKIPDTVEEIGDKAFRNMIGVEEFVIPASVKTIGDSAFEIDTSISVSHLKKVVFAPNSQIEVIARGLFNNQSSLEQVILPQSLKKIGIRAFGDCSALTKIDLPKTVEEIGVSAFERCVSLEEINIPANIKKLGVFANDASGNPQNVGMFLGIDNNKLIINFERDYVKDSDLPKEFDGWSSGKKVVWSKIDLQYKLSDDDQTVKTSMVAQRYQGGGDTTNTNFFEKPILEGKTFKGFALNGEILVDLNGIYKAENKQIILNAVENGEVFVAIFE